MICILGLDACELHLGDEEVFNDCNNEYYGFTLNMIEVNYHSKVYLYTYINDCI